MIPTLGHLLKNHFLNFFENLASRYPDFQSYSFNGVGSIGFLLKEHLQLMAAKLGMPVNGSGITDEGTGRLPCDTLDIKKNI